MDSTAAARKHSAALGGGPPPRLLDDRDDLPPIYAGNNVDGWELVGIDVDNYSKGDGPPKRGAEQLRDLESELGQLPVTALSGARLHTGSCIAVYLVPKSYRFTGKAADSIEVIQKRHRYMVVHPSTNPDAKGADGSRPSTSGGAGGARRPSWRTRGGPNRWSGSRTECRLWRTSRSCPRPGSRV